MRQFLSATGRQWSVELFRVNRFTLGSQASIAVSGSVLRFSSPDGFIFDLQDWPSDWERFTDKGLLSLLGRALMDSAFPLELSAPRESTRRPFIIARP